MTLALTGVARWRRLLGSTLLGAAFVAPAGDGWQFAVGPAPGKSPLEGVEPSRLPELDRSTDRELERLRAEAGASLPAGRAGDAGRIRSRDAAWLLGLLSLHGLAVPLDLSQAQARFRQAHQLGHRLAAAGLAWCAIDGCQGLPDPGAARRWITPLRAADPGRAIYFEWLIDQKLRQLRVASPESQRESAAPIPGRDLLVRAAQLGNPQAQVELGLESVAFDRLDDAVEFFRAAAPRSPAAAVNARIVTERLQGKTAPSQQPTADQLFAQARRYHRGDGVPANYAEAVRLYKLATDRGNAPARHMLEKIFSRASATAGVDIAWMRQLSVLEESPQGAVTVSAPPPGGGLQRDATAIYDLVPRQWRSARRAP